MDQDIKYILVKWPEIQDFMEHPRYKESFSAQSINEEDPNGYWFVPEDLYYEIKYPPIQLPEGFENYKMDFTRVDRDQNCLVLLGDDSYKVVKAACNWNINSPFPILLDDPVLLDGFNCEIIAVEQNGDL